jgi:hypothetical protein
VFKELGIDKMSVEGYKGNGYEKVCGELAGLFAEEEKKFYVAYNSTKKGFNSTK